MGPGTAMLVSGLVQLAGKGLSAAFGAKSRREATRAQNRINDAANKLDTETFGRKLQTADRALDLNKSLFAGEKARTEFTMGVKAEDLQDKQDRMEGGIKTNLLDAGRQQPFDRIKRLDRSLLKLDKDNMQ